MANADQEKEEKEYLGKLKKGWTLHLWRNSTPHNMWLESPKKGSTINLCSETDRALFRKLRDRCKLKSKEGIVHYPGMFSKMFRPADEGLAQHEIWEYDEAKEK